MPLFSESRFIQFRTELFNAWNHTQFSNLFTDCAIRCGRAAKWTLTSARSAKRARRALSSFHLRWFSKVRIAAIFGLVYGAALFGQALPGTRDLTLKGDFADRMLDGMDRWLLRELAAAPARRDARSSPAEEKRKRFAKIIGVVDRRIPFESPALDATVSQPALVAETPAYKVWAVRWPVLDGVFGEGLLLEPLKPPIARVVALPEADWTPEMAAGLMPGLEPRSQFARRLAENGCLVLVPVLIDRQPVRQYGRASRRPTNQTRREFVYRMAFEMGRHIAGYEVQKVLAAVDWFASSAPARPSESSATEKAVS